MYLHNLYSDFSVVFGLRFVLKLILLDVPDHFVFLWSDFGASLLQIRSHPRHTNSWLIARNYNRLYRLPPSSYSLCMAHYQQLTFLCNRGLFADLNDVRSKDIFLYKIDASGG